jgi:hypothetical protein
MKELNEAAYLNDGDVKNVCGNGGEDVRHIKVRKMKMNSQPPGDQFPWLAAGASGPDSDV